MTSRMVGASARIIVIRSTPKPSPPAGGMLDQFAVCGANLHPADHQVEVLGDPGGAPVRPGQRRDLAGEVLDEHRVPDVRLDQPLVQLEQDLARAPRRIDVHVLSLGHLGQVGPVQGDRLAHHLRHQLHQRGPSPWLRQVESTAPVLERQRAPDGHRRRLGQGLVQLHHVLVGAVGLVGLEHRELGVVLPVDPLVAKVPPDLEDPFEPPHQQPLQVELRGDAQVQVEVQRLVMRHERPGQRPPVRRLQHGRLHLEEVPTAQGASQRGERPGSGPNHPASFVAGGELEIALAESDLGIPDAVPLLGERPEGLRQERELLDLDGQLAPPGGDDLAPGPHDVPQVEVVEQRVPGPHGLFAAEQLEVPGGVTDGEEGELAVPPEQDDPPGHADPSPGGRAGGKASKVLVLPNVRQARGDVEPQRVRLDPPGPQALELVSSSGDGLGQPAVGFLPLPGGPVVLSHLGPGCVRRSAAAPPG